MLLVEAAHGLEEAAAATVEETLRCTLACKRRRHFISICSRPFQRRAEQRLNQAATGLGGASYLRGGMGEGERAYLVVSRFRIGRSLSCQSTTVALE